MSVLRCQANAYETELEVEVTACIPANGGFALTLDRTLLYPGGGGQPADVGTIDGVELGAPTSTTTDGATYQVSQALELGPAMLHLDWARRYDHMQQHTAQHLLSALAQDHLGLETEAFHLNPERCDVVLTGAAFDAELMLQLETLANDAIRRGMPVGARLIEPDRLQAEGVRSRRLPPGHSGPLRVVEIDGIDVNTCGGTHVANTAELQVIRLLQYEESKGTYRVHYWAGERVLEGHRRAWAQSAEITERLCCGPAEHVGALERIMQQAKVMERKNKALNGEVSAAVGQSLIARGGSVLHYHRPDGEMGFLSQVAGQVVRELPDTIILLTASDAGGEGVFILLGPDSIIEAIGGEVATALQGRGGGRGGRYQGRASGLNRVEEAMTLLNAADPS